MFFDFEDDDGAVLETVDEALPKDPAEEIDNKTSTTKVTLTNDNNTTTEKSLLKKLQKNKIKRTTTTTKPFMITPILTHSSSSL